MARNCSGNFYGCHSFFIKLSPIEGEVGIFSKLWKILNADIIPYNLKKSIKTWIRTPWSTADGL